MERFDVFVRNWWKMENGKKVPHPTARKTYQLRNVTREEAYNFCQEWNKSHDPGVLSRMAEFQKV